MSLPNWNKSCCSGWSSALAAHQHREFIFRRAARWRRGRRLGSQSRAPLRECTGQHHAQSLGNLPGTFDGLLVRSDQIRLANRKAGTIDHQAKIRCILRQGHQRLCQPDDLRQGCRRQNLPRRGMVEGHAVAQHRIEPPAVDQPAAHFGVRGRKKLRFLGQQTRVVGRIEQKAPIRLANGVEHDQFADVMQQTRQISLVGGRVGSHIGNPACQFADQQRMRPEIGDIDAFQPGIPFKKTLDGKAGCQRTDQARAQGDQAGIDILQLAATA